MKNTIVKLRSRVFRATNRVLQPAGLQLVRTRQEKPWDAYFASWIEEAKRSGVDPNDVGDRDWSGRALEACTRHIFPRVNPESIVLELGPGSGRLTRHVLPRCREMILADYSEMVCTWLREYLQGKGTFRVHHLDRPILPMVADDSVDFVFANGVFEHIDPDETDFFLQEFVRVLKPGRHVWFNFDNFMSTEGLVWFRDHYPPAAGQRRAFRFYHPDFLKRMAEMRGFEQVVVETNDSRFGLLTARKPDRPSSMATTNG